LEWGTFPTGRYTALISVAQLYRALGGGWSPDEIANQEEQTDDSQNP
jgi:hypothetical protein